MTVGITADGYRFVSREGKQGMATRYFSPLEVPREPQNTAILLAAAAWLGNIGQRVQFQSGVANGDIWNVEITYPNLNVIQYEEGHLTFLFPLLNEVTGELSTSIDKLELSGKDLIKVPHRSSIDGITIKQTSNWTQFHARPVRKVELPDVSAIITWLDSVPRDAAFTSCELLGMRFTKTLCPKLGNNILIARETFLKMLKQVKTPSDCEGLVLNDGEMLVKIVPQWFVEQNQFEHAVRNGIKKRSFSNNLDRFFNPAHGAYFVDEQIQMLWREKNRTDVQTLSLLKKIVMLRDQYMTIQARGLFNGPGGQTQYKLHAHNQTMVEFAWFREQLALTLVNTR